MQVKTVPAEFKTSTSDDGQTGIVEAIVSVHTNVDHDGDVVKAGFFDDYMKSQADAGKTVPWVFAHNWKDPDAYIGTVDPSKAETVTFKAKDGETHTGYKVVAEMPIGKDPAAAKSFRLLDDGILDEFSYAYEPAKDGGQRSVKGGEKQAPNHRRDLIKGAMIECGPCLKGANSLTTTVSTLSKDWYSPLGIAVEYSDEGPTDAQLAALLLQTTAQVLQVAGVLQPDSDGPAGDDDPDADLDIAQATALRTAAQNLTDIAHSIASSTAPPKSADPARTRKGDPASSAAKGRDDYARKAAAELYLLDDE